MSQGFEEHAAARFADCLEILCRKRVERGPNNIVKQGLTGVIDRMQGDKLERVRRWAHQQQLRHDLHEIMPQHIIDQYLPPHDADEGIDGDRIIDDLLDVANYAIIAVMLLEGTWIAPVDAENAGQLVDRLRVHANVPTELLATEYDQKAARLGVVSASTGVYDSGAVR